MESPQFDRQLDLDVDNDWSSQFDKKGFAVDADPNGWCLDVDVEG